MNEVDGAEHRADERLSCRTVDGSSPSRLIPVAWREPFSPAYRDCRRHGETILDIVASVPDLPLGFPERGVVCVNGDVVPRHLWKFVRPKPNSPEQPIAVTLHWPLQGGGSGSGGGAKSIIALVGAIALTALTGGIAAGGIPGLFAAGSIGAHVFAAAVGIAGALAIGALTAPPVSKAQSVSAALDQKAAASATGNVINPGGAIPRVLGTRLMFPPLAGDPIVEIVDDDEYVEACFILNGPHALNDIRIGDAPIAGAGDIQYETREGWDDDTPVTLTVRQGKQTPLQVQMSSHTVDPTNQQNLKDPATPSIDLPVFHAFSAKNSPDEIWLHLALPGGLCLTSTTTDDKSIPFRIQMRKRGDVTWINLPEIHLSERTASQLHVAVKFMWATYPGVIPAIPTQSGWVYASINVPGQATAPTTAGWVANSYFNDGAGSDYLQAGVEASSKVTNTLLFDNRVEFYLDAGTFSKGIYDFQIMRGSAYDTSTFTGSAYTYSGTVLDFFTYSNATTPQIPLSRNGVSDTVALDILQSIWNEHPIQTVGLALISVKALNRRLDALSVLASGYVKDWDGSGWNTWTTTSNPAAHYVDILSGALNKDPLPDDIRDDAGIVAWRTKCTSNSWDADIIVEDSRTEDVLTLLASCGYARPYQSELYGVAVDDDHSSDDIVQVFSPRNIKSFRAEKAFARLPNGFIVTYADAGANYQDTQATVYSAGYTGGDDGRFEAVAYDGIVDATKLATRAQFDLDQAMLRSTFYYLDADMESIVCRKGDLVVVQHDSFDSRAGFAYVETILTLGGNITGFVLDNQIPVTNDPDMHAMTDMHAVTDMHDVGVTTGIAIRHNDGTISTHALSDATGSLSTITLATPIATDATIVAFDDSDEIYGSLVVAGALTLEYRRLLVAGIAPAADGVFSLTLVDEAPDLVRIAA